MCRKTYGGNTQCAHLKGIALLEPLSSDSYCCLARTLNRDQFQVGRRLDMAVWEVIDFLIVHAELTANFDE